MVEDTAARHEAVTEVKHFPCTSSSLRCACCKSACDMSEPFFVERYFCKQVCPPIHKVFLLLQAAAMGATMTATDMVEAAADMAEAEATVVSMSCFRLPHCMQ